MHATGHEIVARALGRRLREDRGLDLEESAIAEISTGRLHQPMPQNDVLLQLGSTQVEVAMPESKLLRGQILVSCASNWNRRRARGPNDRQPRRSNFHVPRA